jgi:hypothetical protein
VAATKSDGSKKKFFLFARCLCSTSKYHLREAREERKIENKNKHEMLIKRTFVDTFMYVSEFCGRCETLCLEN